MFTALRLKLFESHSCFRPYADSKMTGRTELPPLTPIKRKSQTFRLISISPRPRSAHREKLDSACFAEIAWVLLLRPVVPMFMYAKAAASDAVAFGIVERKIAI